MSQRKMSLATIAHASALQERPQVVTLLTVHFSTYGNLSGRHPLKPLYLTTWVSVNASINASKSYDQAKTMSVPAMMEGSTEAL